MKKKYIVNGNDDPVLSVELKHVLNCFRQQEEFTWCIQWLNGVGNPKDMTFLELEEITNKSELGLIIDFEGLSQLMETFETINEIHIVANKEAKEFFRFNDNDKLYEYYDLSIELVDSSYWEICTNDSYAQEKIENTLEGVEIVKLNT